MNKLRVCTVSVVQRSTLAKLRVSRDTFTAIHEGIWSLPPPPKPFLYPVACRLNFRIKHSNKKSGGKMKDSVDPSCEVCLYRKWKLPPAPSTSGANIKVDAVWKPAVTQETCFNWTSCQVYLRVNLNNAPLQRKRSGLRSPEHLPPPLTRSVLRH
jgi:hypothetical protein